MSIPQPRRTKSSYALRGQAASQQRSLKPPPIPTNLSVFPPTPPLFSGSSARSASTASSGPRTPPPHSQQIYRSPGKHEYGLNNTFGITERLKLVTSELESYVEETESSDENVHVAVRLKPNFNKEREVWTSDPVRGYIGSKLGEFFFGRNLSGNEVNSRLCVYWRGY
jgi:hypothetical protein